MFWIAQVVAVSFVIIYILHNLYFFFKETLTVPKMKDMVRRPQQRYDTLFRELRMQNEAPSGNGSNGARNANDANDANDPFINKYQPRMFSEFEQLTPVMVGLLTSLIQMHELNLLIVGDSGSGKTSLVNAIIREYYGVRNNPENVMILNSLKDQGIQYYRNDMKIFCQTSSLIPGKKKLIILDDIDSINEQSQQVFRNCIDKYNHNVSFIASCINVQKVIDNLQSRQIIVKINPIDPQCLQKI